MNRTDDFLSYLYSSDNREAYEAALALVNEIEDLKKQLAEAKVMEPAPHLVTLTDFNLMVSMAAQQYVKRAFPIELSGKSVSSGHEPHLFMIEAFISLLNQKELLRKPVKFDYRR